MRNLSRVFILLILTTGFLFAADYTIDKTHSSVGFKVSHMVISKVSGKFTDFSASLSFDANKLSDFSIETIIKIESVNTDNEKRNNHLKSDEFFDAAKYPEMIFKSTKVEKTDKGYVAHGTLTLHGVSKDVDLAFQLNGPIKDPWGNMRIGIEASTEINRQDFGVKWSNTLDGGGLVVSDEVEIFINAEFIQTK